MTDVSGRQLTSEAVGQDLALISSLSFEPRSLAVAGALAAGSSLRRWTCLKNLDIEIDVEELQAKAISLAASAGVEFDLVETERRHPLQLADRLTQLIESTRGSPLRWIIDVSTMTHETALMIVSAISELAPEWRDLTYVYNTAEQYSHNERERDRRWVSRGIQGVRSVVGYSGLWSPGEPAVLVALPGFDLERVQRVVEEIEPERVVVGVARPSQAGHDWMYERNIKVAKAITAMRKGSTFEYEALNPMDAARQVADALVDVAQNVIIAPLNTKVSTIALGMLARQHPRWQVCYAPALVYNLHYATASDVFQMHSHAELERQIGLLGSPPVPI